MRLVEEADAAGDRKGNIAASEFELQLQRMEVRAVKHRDLIQLNALFAKVEHALRDERRLLVRVAARDDAGLDSGFPRRCELFRELVRVRSDRGIGDFQDFRRATVIGLNRKYSLRAIQMTSPDIRAGVALLIAAMSAKGKSVIHNIEQIDRGYERIDERLNALGAQIKRVE